MKTIVIYIIIPFIIGFIIGYIKDIKRGDEQ